MVKSKASNNGDRWGLWALLMIIVLMAAAGYYGSKDFGSPVAPDWSVGIEVVAGENGLMLRELICFEKATGDILWRRVVPAEAVEGDSHVRQVPVPQIDGATESVVGLGLKPDGSGVIFLFQLQENRLVAQGVWSVAGAELDSQVWDKLKGEAADAVYPFLRSNP